MGIFGRDNGGDAPPPDMPGRPPTQSDIPPTVTWRVRRLQPGFVAGPGENIPIEELLLEGHEIDYNKDLVRVSRYHIDPVHGPSKAIVKIVNGYIDLEEVVTFHSSLLTH